MAMARTGATAAAGDVGYVERTWGMAESEVEVNGAGMLARRGRVVEQH